MEFSAVKFSMRGRSPFFNAQPLRDHAEEKAPANRKRRAAFQVFGNSENVERLRVMLSGRAGVFFRRGAAHFSELVCVQKVSSRGGLCVRKSVFSVLLCVLLRVKR